MKKLFIKSVYALNFVSKIYNKEKPKLKCKLLDPIKSAGFSIKEAKAFGFKFCKKFWRSNLKLKRNLGGRPAVKGYFKKLIESFHQENSSLAANRFLKLQNTDARYRNKTLTDDFSSFKLNDYLSFSSFYKYMPKCIKKPHRKTDLCIYCQTNKVILYNLGFFNIFILLRKY